MFQTTRWSLIREAGADSGQGRRALETLCRQYRPAALAYIRACGHDSEAAEDLVQGFFERFLAREMYRTADPSRGRFRTFLRVSLRHYLVNEGKAAARLRRQPAGFDEDIDPDSLLAQDAGPERAFERAWALTLLDHAMRRLADEAAAQGKAELHAQLREFLLERPDSEDYARVAAATGLRPNTIAVAIHRQRQRLRELVAEEVAHTVADPAQVEEELARLGAPGEPPARQGGA